MGIKGIQRESNESDGNQRNPIEVKEIQCISMGSNENHRDAVNVPCLRRGGGPPRRDRRQPPPPPLSTQTLIP